MDDIFNLDNEELKLINNKNTNKNKLGFAVLLKHFQLVGRYPSEIKSIDPMLIQDVADQLKIKKSVLKNFEWEGRTIERFKREIRTFTGFKEATIDDNKHLAAWLIREIFVKAPKPAECIEYAYEYFRTKRIEPLTSKQMERCMQTAHKQFEQNLFTKIYNKLSAATIRLLQQLLDYNFNEINDNDEQEQKLSFDIKFKHLKKDIPGAKLKNVLFELEKIAKLRQLNLPDKLLHNISMKLLKKYYTRVLAEPPGNILEHKPKTRYALFALFCYFRLKLLLDSLADLLLQLIHKMQTSAENYINKKIIADVKHVNGKFDILFSLAKTSIANPNGIIKKVIYPQVSQETLTDLVTELKYQGKWYQNEVRTKIRSLYSHASRKVLLTLLDAFEFKTNIKKSQRLLKAIKFIKSYKEQAMKYYPNTKLVPIKHVIAKDWLPLVLEKQEAITQINCFNYEIAVLEEVRKQLRCKKIWITGSIRYRNPDEDLPKDFAERKEYYYNLLGLPSNAQDFIKPIKEQLHKSLTQLNNNIVNNNKVKIINTKKGARIRVSPSDPQPEPPHIKKLHKEIKKRWPLINFIDILKETDLQIGFTEEMHSIASRENLSKEELQRRILLILYGIGSNIGLKRISAAQLNTSYSDLRYVKRKFVTVANVRAAIVKIVNKILDIRDPRIWGEATTSLICDSKKIEVWDQNLMVEWHARYKGPGIMVYWHIDRGSACVYSHSKTCSSSEVGAMIKGILNHFTSMKVDQAYMDTHGQSICGFGICRFLSVCLLPRLKNINKQKLYYPSAELKAKYPNIQELLKASINWKDIADGYEEAVKHAVALKLGIVDPDVMIKRFDPENSEHPVYKVFTEVGKADKTIFLCNYIQSEKLRIKIHEFLNIVERVNSIINFIFFGKLGEITTNLTEEHELTIVCLHLLQVCMVYINTIIIQDILLTSKWQNILTAADRRALSPLFHSNINPYGVFPLNMGHRLGVPILNKKLQESIESDFVLEELD